MYPDRPRPSAEPAAPAKEELHHLLELVPRIVARRNAKLGGPLDADEVRDTAQDAILAVLTKLPTYRPRAPLAAWIHGICCLEVLAASRGKQRLRRLAGSVLDEDIHDPDAHKPLDALGDAAEVHALLATVSGIEADIVRMKFFDGLSFPQLADVLELPLSSVKTHYYRGLARMRDARGVRRANAS